MEGLRMLPNMGRIPGKPPPASRELRDSEDDLDVWLYVSTLPARYGEDDPRTLHWKIVWTVADTMYGPIFRRIEILYEGSPPHFINWGARTAYMTKDSLSNPKVLLGRLTRTQRALLEVVANSEPVYAPHPNILWNCQDWIYSILENRLVHEFVGDEWKRLDLVAAALQKMEQQHI